MLKKLISRANIQLVWMTHFVCRISFTVAVDLPFDTWHERAGKCYLITPVDADKDTANSLCTMRGGTLVEIYSMAEFNYLVAWLSSSGLDYWTGYTKISDPYWPVSQRPIPGDAWHDEEPNNTGTCARLKVYPDGTRHLADMHCHYSFHGICQKQPRKDYSRGVLTSLSSGDSLCHMEQRTVGSVIECASLCSSSSLCVYMRFDDSTRLCKHFQDKGSEPCQTPSYGGNYSDYKIARLC